MMETILITGAGPNGVTGKLLKESLSSKFEILSPASIELDLTDCNQVSRYFQNHDIDYVIHCATYRPISYINKAETPDELECNLKMFYSLAAQNRNFKKMIYFGSGAELDKSKPIINASEEDFGNSIPNGKYGFGKYIMNLHSKKSLNIYNFRLFGTVNKFERPSKNVISNLCVKAINALPLELNRNCRFSFININDLSPLIGYALHNDLKNHDYNIVMSESYLLSEVAEIINKISGKKLPVKFRHEGLNPEYTANNERILNEFNPKLSSLEQSVEEVYHHYKDLSNSIDLSEIDSRWNRK